MSVTKKLVARTYAINIAMNLVTFNDSLSAADFKMEGFQDEARSRLKVALTAPVFLCQDPPNSLLAARDNYDVLALIGREPRALPFPSIRLFVVSNQDDLQAGGGKGWKVWGTQRGNQASFSVKPVGSAGMDMTVWFSTVAGDAASERPSFLVAVQADGQWLNNKQVDASPELCHAAQAIFTSICWFIREAYSSANFIAAVSPKKVGKSVEWLKARTHYVLLNRHHPVNKLGLLAGHKLDMSARDLQRQAHSRRAHNRVLLSPRFRHMVGQTIRIKSCWVGPKEWEQAASIYRLVERVAGDYYPRVLA